MYKKFSHILLISPFICPFFFLSNLSGLACDGYRRGYASFAPFLLYFIFALDFLQCNCQFKHQVLFRNDFLSANSDCRF